MYGPTRFGNIYKIHLMTPLATSRDRNCHFLLNQWRYHRKTREQPQ